MPETGEEPSLVVDSKKGRRGQYPRKKKNSQLGIKLEGGDHGLNFKLNRNDDPGLNLKAKTKSEQPTDTTLSP